MKKKLVGALAVGLMIFGMSGMASATPFASTIDFSSMTKIKRGCKQELPYLEIKNNDHFTFTLDGLHASDLLTDATLSLRHNGNSNNQDEVWSAFAKQSGPDIHIGKLASSTTEGVWTTDTWTLSKSALELIAQNNWGLTVNLKENTNHPDYLNIDYATLAGNYTNPTPAPIPQPNPVPGAVWLFGSGLAGLVGLRRNKKD